MILLTADVEPDGPFKTAQYSVVSVAAEWTVVEYPCCSGSHHAAIDIHSDHEKSSILSSVRGNPNPMKNLHKQSFLLFLIEECVLFSFACAVNPNICTLLQPLIIKK